MHHPQRQPKRWLPQGGRGLPRPLMRTASRPRSLRRANVLQRSRRSRMATFLPRRKVVLPRARRARRLVSNPLALLACSELICLQSMSRMTSTPLSRVKTRPTLPTMSSLSRLKPKRTRTRTRLETFIIWFVSRIFLLEQSLTTQARFPSYTVEDA
jgi:hypothetical protein